MPTKSSGSNFQNPSLIGNGRCDNGGNENSEDCGWDGGECFAFNLEYPDCTSRFAFKISNGICEDAVRRDGGMGGMNTQKVPALKIYEITYKFGRKVFGKYPLNVNVQSTIGLSSPSGKSSYGQNTYGSPYNNSQQIRTGEI